MKSITLIILFLSILSCKKTDNLNQLYPLKVIDGSTFLAENKSDDANIIVKLNAIETLLDSDVYYDESVKELEQLIMNRQLTFYNFQKIEENTFKADVYVDQLNVANELLKKGLVKMNDTDVIHDSLRQNYVQSWIVAKTMKKGIYK